MIKNLPTKYLKYNILFLYHTGNLFASSELSIVNKLVLVGLAIFTLVIYSPFIRIIIDYNNCIVLIICYNL